MVWTLVRASGITEEGKLEAGGIGIPVGNLANSSAPC